MICCQCSYALLLQDGQLVYFQKPSGQLISTLRSIVKWFVNATNCSLEWHANALSGDFDHPWRRNFSLTKNSKQLACALNHSVR